MKNIILKNSMLTVEISPIGAELQSIKAADGVERLYQGDTPFWANRAPILFPVAGSFRDDRYQLDGKVYQMTKHGFLRGEVFEVEHTEETSATLLYRKKHPGFPFDYEFRARFTLVGNAIRVAYIVDSTGDDTFFFCTGGHEAYLIPGGVDNYEIVFDRDEPLNTALLHGSLLTHETAPVAAENGVMPLRTEYFSHDALIFPQLRSKSVVLRSRLHDRAIRVDFAGHGCILFWTKPGAPYLCIEPWTNAPDTVDADGLIEHKPGAIRLAPGERDIREHVITIL